MDFTIHSKRVPKCSIQLYQSQIQRNLAGDIGYTGVPGMRLTQPFDNRQNTGFGQPMAVPPSRVMTSQLRAALATQRAAQSFQLKMSVAKHQACFTTKLQGQNLAMFSHSAVTPIAYLKHTPTKRALIT